MGKLPLCVLFVPLLFSHILSVSLISSAQIIGYRNGGKAAGSSVTYQAQPTLPYLEVFALNRIGYALGMNPAPDYGSDACQSNDPASDGIYCNCTIDAFCHVTGLVFENKQLNGRISSSMDSLTYLRELDLSNNQLGGAIPASLGNLSQLYRLDLSYNYFQGEIPSSLGNLTFLNYLWLYYNFFNGSIPPTLGALKNLVTLSVTGNMLTGSIPHELGNITGLEYLFLADNKFSGPIPSELGNLKNLTTMYLDGNKLTGELPKSFENLTNLDVLDVRGNNLSGEIPPIIENWQQVRILSFAGNNFAGTLPAGISRLKKLERLHVSDLRSNETNGGFNFPQFSGSTNMKSLMLRNCSIIGEIPKEIDTMSNLTYLDLSFNKLTGEIPSSLHKLQYLYLTRNNFSGSIPIWFSNSSARFLDFSYNSFKAGNLSQPTDKQDYSYNTSKIDLFPSRYVNSFACCTPNITNATSPLGIKHDYCSHKSKYSSLHINCGGESTTIEGNYYEEDNHTLPFYVSPKKNWANSISGDFITLTTSPRDYIRNITCGISVPDAPLYSTARISPLALTYHGLCLHNGNYTVRLHFAEIVYTDYKDYSSLGTRVFDVYIQGNRVLKDFNIKDELNVTDKVVVKNFTATVKDNPLEIHFYWAGEGTIYIPPKLYGPLISAISVTADFKPARRFSPGIIAVITVASILIPLVVLAFIWKMGWLERKKLLNYELQGTELKNRSITFKQIADATENFSPGKEIGKGGSAIVYKAELQDGSVLAVKKLSQMSAQGYHEFVNEVAALSTLNHENLVRLLGWCVEDDQRLLIYEYMENNSLQHVLFGPEPKLKLNWQKRHKICLGIANGLAYLHGKSMPKIVHRDIKPNNILLDGNLNAKISDFGLAKFYDEGRTQLMTRLGGTHGYMAPEYSSRGILNEKIDVYSFGVVTLEIISGLSNADYIPNEESVFLLDKAYILRKEDNLMDLVDETIAHEPDFSVDQARTMLELAMMCIEQSPTLRPTMSEAVSILEGEKTIEEVSASKQLNPTNIRGNPSFSASTHSTSTEGISIA